MPAGTMSWSIYPFRSMPLEGFQERNCKGVIVIEYHIQSGMKSGVRFQGTSRTAFLP